MPSSAQPSHVAKNPRHWFAVRGAFDRVSNDLNSLAEFWPTTLTQQGIAHGKNPKLTCRVTRESVVAHFFKQSFCTIHSQISTVFFPNNSCADFALFVVCASD